MVVAVHGSHPSWKVIDSSGIFPPFKGLDSSGKFWQCDVKVWDSSRMNLLRFKFDKFALRFVCFKLKNLL